MDGCVRSMIPLTDSLGLRWHEVSAIWPEKSNCVRVWSNSDSLQGLASSKGGDRDMAADRPRGENRIKERFSVVTCGAIR